MKKVIFISILLYSGLTAFGQSDSSKVALSGEWRSYYLYTQNQNDLKDFYALAIGGKIGLSYHISDQFSLNSMGYVSWNTNIQDLSIPDATTGKLSRYELGLFDVADPDNHLILLPGELNIAYANNKHAAKIGRFKLKSPFINPQDGRMIPTLVQGIWYKYKLEGKGVLQAGVLNNIAPRSTGKFYNIGESIGLYPVGRQINGRPSYYRNYTTSDFIALANISYKLNDKAEIMIWEYYTDNIFNTFYLRPTYRLNASNKISVEWLRQDKIGHGGSATDSLRYFEQNHANVLGFQYIKKLKHGSIELNYDHILDGGRFLFPREWGRESLFSFQKRERSEGSESNHALMISYEQSLSLNKSSIRAITSIGHHWKASTSDPQANKYALPDYTHFNIDLFYGHSKMNNLKPELLLTYKLGHRDYTNPNLILNKVDMFQINMILNYTF